MEQREDGKEASPKLPKFGRYYVPQEATFTSHFEDGGTSPLVLPVGTFLQTTKRSPKNMAENTIGFWFLRLSEVKHGDSPFGVSFYRRRGWDHFAVVPVDEFLQKCVPDRRETDIAHLTPGGLSEERARELIDGDCNHRAMDDKIGTITEGLTLASIARDVVLAAEKARASAVLEALKEEDPAYGHRAC